MSDESWTLDHRPQIIRQTETRPGPVQSDGSRWIERRLTGMGTASCSCGYTTGLVAREQLPEITAFVGEHSPSSRPELAGGEQE